MQVFIQIGKSIQKRLCLLGDFRRNEAKFLNFLFLYFVKCENVKTTLTTLCYTTLSVHYIWSEKKGKQIFVIKLITLWNVWIKSDQSFENNNIVYCLKSISCQLHFDHVNELFPHQKQCFLLHPLKANIQKHFMCSWLWLFGLLRNSTERRWPSLSLLICIF